MNHVLITGSFIVTVALVFYSLALKNELKNHVLSRKLFRLFRIGLLFDFTATCFMIAGSPNTPFTVHGFIGYSALTAMSIEVFLLWKLYRAEGRDSVIPPRIHKYTLFAYTWWVLAYITGGMIAILN